MADILPPAPIDAPFSSYNWADWYKKVRDAINAGAEVAWSQITDFTGSNLTQIATRNHDDLQNILGNGTRHVSTAEAAALASGLTVVITTAKLTGLGANGSMTFTNGVLTAQTQAT